MKLIVGLGNPGTRYFNTRHNVGFEFLDYIAEKYSINICNNKFNGIYGEININGEKVFLLKPLSFMNLSGEVVKKFILFFKISLDDIIVIQDDIDLPLGKVKLSYNHGSGGHNGIKNIIENLNTKEFLRLRVGIDCNNCDIKDYVLGKFDNDEINNINIVYKKLDNILNDFIFFNRDKILNKYNSLN